MQSLSFKEHLLLTEVRDPSLTYTNKYKGKAAEKAIDRVILELTGNQSGSMSRLTKRYERLDKALKLMNAKRAELNEKVKIEVEGLFDPADVIYTRVVETVTMTITLSKAEAKETKASKVVVDYKSIAKALEALIAPELEDKVKEITALYTTIIPPEDTPAALRVKSKLEEGLVLDTWKKIKSAVAKGIKNLASWAIKYDKKLAAIKKQAGLA
jgi:hypothetical protein